MILAFQFIPKTITKRRRVKIQTNRMLLRDLILKVPSEKHQKLIGALMESINKPVEIQTERGRHVFWIEKV